MTHLKKNMAKHLITYQMVSGIILLNNKQLKKELTQEQAFIILKILLQFRKIYIIRFQGITNEFIKTAYRLENI